MSELREATCGDCIAFNVVDREADGTVRGRCAFRPELPIIPDTLPACPSLKVRASLSGKVKAPKKAALAPRRRSRGDDRLKAPPRPTINNPTTGETEGEITVDRNGLKQVLRELLEEETLFGYPDIGARWAGGTLEIKPKDPDLQARSIPLETLFHKVVMVRDRLRVLESKINGNKKLTEQDKVDLQSYISKCYGSLTTFNSLFADKADHFKSK